MENNNSVQNLNPAPPVSPVKQTPPVLPTPQIPPPISKPKPKLPIIIGIILFLFVAASAAGFYVIKQQSLKQTACTLEAKVCPNGTSVGRTGPSCSFAPCPTAKASPTPNPTANWKTYINTVPFFEIKYPPENVKATNLSMNNPKIVLELIYYSPSKSNVENKLGGRDLNDGYFVKIDWEDSIQAETLEKAAKQSLAFSKIIDESNLIFSDLEKTNLNGIQAYKFDTETKSLTSITYIISNGTKMFRIDLNALGTQNDRQSYMNIMNQILSTFKFTDITPTPSSLPFDCQGEEGCFCNTDGDCTSHNCKKETPDTDKSMSSGVCTK